jgi:hypothetical protein
VEQVLVWPHAVALVDVVICSWAEVAPQSATKTQKHNPTSQGPISCNWPSPAPGPGPKGRQKKTGKTTYICARSQKKVRTYLYFILFYFIFSAFLGVSRQGEFENTRKKIE